MKLLNIASILVISASSMLLGTGCMAEGNTDDQADEITADQGADETKAATNDDSATDDENTGEAKQAWCGGYGGWGLGYGGFYGGGLGCGGCGGFYGGCGGIGYGGFYGGCGGCGGYGYGGGFYGGGYGGCLY